MHTTVRGVKDLVRLDDGVVPLVDHTGEEVLGAAVPEDEAPNQLPERGSPDLLHKLDELRLLAIAPVDDREVPRVERLGQQPGNGTKAMRIWGCCKSLARPPHPTSATGARGSQWAPTPKS